MRSILPSQEHWDEEVPSWARNWRSDIGEHIARCLGAEFGNSVQFVDSGAERFGEREARNAGSPANTSLKPPSGAQH